MEEKTVPEVETKRTTERIRERNVPPMANKSAPTSFNKETISAL